MKSLVILLTCVVTVYAGVGVVTPEIQREALALYDRYCSGNSDRGQEGNLYVYCKRAKNDIEKDLQFEITLDRNENLKKQVVFIQPPSYKYNHEVTVTGGGGKAQQTEIYVLPAKNEHTVNIDDQTTGQVEPEKPRLYFLPDTDSDQSPPPPPTPETGYLPPRY